MNCVSFICIDFNNGDIPLCVHIIGHILCNYKCSLHVLDMFMI